MHHLTAYGWNSDYAATLAPGESLTQVARVVQEHKEAYLVRAVGMGLGNIWAEISGKMRHEGTIRSDFPAVGDWVILRGIEKTQNDGPVHIARILPRKTTLARRVDAGHEQVLAVNVDIAFLGTSMNDNFNVRRLERYLGLAHDAGVQPVVLLTKADLCDGAAIESFIAETRAVAGDAPIHAISVVTGRGMDAVRGHLTLGTSAVILGSSGIGKSTLVNYLAEADLQDMMESREFDDKGRHCTTFRHLIRTATGGLIIDTPGLRGITLGEATDALAATFTDIDALAATCKFTDCKHETEPGCAIKAATEAGTLDPGRLEGYLRMQRELLAIARRENRVLDRKIKKMEKKVTSAMEKKQKRKWRQD